MSNRTLKRIVTLSQVAELFAVSERWINRLTKEKDFPKVARGKYDLMACVRWYVAYLTRQIDDARRGGDSMQRSEERKAAAQASMLELRLARARNEVIEISTAVSVISPVLQTIRSILLGIPKHAARELGNPEIESYLDAFIRRALEEISTIPVKLDDLGGGGGGPVRDVGPGKARRAHVPVPDSDPPRGRKAPVQADGQPVVRPVPGVKPGAQRRKRPVEDQHG
jgi:phage terminase Nu1 subunit (DNA packaging protein)